ncbi:O-methyltransferase family protein [Rhynchospora pubera]|uniref:O-methyltransferase family protein n=1 Tax=Rhynchospora pubera TaxID=906938 RepID=A0AAV8GFS8_9POAL|nr:O-methyltransferase family protein [Rhynchospora pubera]
MTLKCAIELGIPNAIHYHGQPMTLNELHDALSLSINNKSNLWRLLRMLTHVGFLSVRQNTGTDTEPVYDLTPISRLVINKPNSSSLSPFVLAMLDFTFVKSSLYLGDRLKQDKLETFEMAHGCTLWELTGQSPEFNTLINDAMASDSSFLSDFIIKHGEVFQGMSSLIDVGGGSGSVSMAIAKAFPNIQCTVLDLPQVVGHLPADGLVKFVSGDMFSNIPPADAIFLKCILHDWADEDCIKILQRCKEAISSRDARGKVIIVDAVVGSVNSTTHRESQLLLDMMMMTACSGGKERDEDEWWNMFKEARFSSYRITASLGFRSIIEVYP